MKSTHSSDATDPDDALQEIDRAYRRLRNKQFIDELADGITSCYSAGLIRADAFYKNNTPGKLPRYILKSNEYPFTPAGDVRLEELRIAGADVPHILERDRARMTPRELRQFLSNLEAYAARADIGGATTVEAVRTATGEELAARRRRRTIFLIAGAGAAALALVALSLSALA